MEGGRPAPSASAALWDIAGKECVGHASTVSTTGLLPALNFKDFGKADDNDLNSCSGSYTSRASSRCSSLASSRGGKRPPAVFDVPNRVNVASTRGSRAGSVASSRGAGSHGAGSHAGSHAGSQAGGARIRRDMFLSNGSSSSKAAGDITVTDLTEVEQVEHTVTEKDDKPIRLNKLPALVLPPTRAWQDPIQAIFDDADDFASSSPADRRPQCVNSAEEIFGSLGVGEDFDKYRMLGSSRPQSECSDYDRDPFLSSAPRAPAFMQDGKDGREKFRVAGPKHEPDGWDSLFSDPRRRGRGSSLSGSSGDAAVGPRRLAEAAYKSEDLVPVQPSRPPPTNRYVRRDVAEEVLVVGGGGRADATASSGLRRSPPTPNTVREVLGTGSTKVAL